MPSPEGGHADKALASVFREEAGRLTGSLIGVLGDWGAAEEIVQDTLLIALEQWRENGIPPVPRAWLLTVARRRAIDSLRREANFRQKLASLEELAPDRDEPDDRLRLLFTCCHPALSREAQVALTLQAVCGFTTAEIASALLVSEAAISQRLARARRKIQTAGIPYRVPTGEDLEERLAGVLAVLYLTFNEGYLSGAGRRPARHDLAEDAAWLCGLLVRLMPGEPEPLGLLALMRLNLARVSARFDDQGDIVLLREQDRSQWDRTAIASAAALIERAATMDKPGPYQLQAAIAACHAEAGTWAATDWPQILILYEMLLRMDSSPVVLLNRAVALWQVAGAAVALQEVDRLAEPLDGYHLFHSVRAQLLRELGSHEEARAAATAAIQLTANRAEQSALQRNLIS